MDGAPARRLPPKTIVSAAGIALALEFPFLAYDRLAAAWVLVAGSFATGVCEEFIFRAFLIEELGELLRSGPMAAGVSLVCFALAHGSGGTGSRRRCSFRE